MYLGRIGLQEAHLLCIPAYPFGALVALWRSSKPALNTIWGALVRKLTVDWEVSVILILGFLQLDQIKKLAQSSSRPAVTGVISTK